MATPPNGLPVIIPEVLSIALTPIPSNSGCKVDNIDNSCENSKVSCKNTISEISPSHYCKNSQITSLKLFLIVTHFVNFKHNFPKEVETFFKNKLKWIKEKSMNM